MIRLRKSRDEWLFPYGLDCSQGPTIPTQTSRNALARSTVTQTIRNEWSLIRKENLTSTHQYTDCPKSGKQTAQERDTGRLNAGTARSDMCNGNWNNIDVLMALGWDFLPAVDLLEQWLRQHQEHRSSSKS